MINSWRASNKLFVENLLAHFQPITQCYKQMKNISTINPATTENMDGMIVKANAPVIDIKVGALP